MATLCQDLIYTALKDDKVDDLLELGWFKPISLEDDQDSASLLLRIKNFRSIQGRPPTFGELNLGPYPLESPAPFDDQVDHLRGVVKYGARAQIVDDLVNALLEIETFDEKAEVLFGRLQEIQEASQNGNGNARSGLEWLTAKETCELVEEKIAFVAWPIAAPGIVTAMSGEWKSAGKTTLLLNMTRQVLEGRMFLQHPTIESPVVYLYEGPPGELRPSLEEAGLEDSGDLHILYRDLNADVQWADTIRGATAKCEEVGARLLIVDTRAEWVEDPNDRENASGFARVSMRAFHPATSTGIAIVVAAHPTKVGGTLTKMFAGTGQWAATAGRIVGIWPFDPENLTGERRRIIEAHGRQGVGNNLPKSAITWHPEEQRYSFEGPVGDARDRDEAEIVLAAIPSGEENAENFETCRQRTKPSIGRDKFRVLLDQLIERELVGSKKETGEKGGRSRTYFRPLAAAFPVRGRVLPDPSQEPSEETA